MVDTLDNKSLFFDLSKRRMWIGMLKVARNCVLFEGPDDPYFVKVEQNQRGNVPFTVEERKKLLEEAAAAAEKYVEFN